MRNNPVYQLLVTSGDQGLLAANQTVEDLLPGQLGIFSRLTGRTANPANPGELREIFFGLGVDKNLDGTKDDVFLSAGQFIQTQGLLAMEKKAYTAPQTKTILIENMRAVPSTEYGLKFHFVSGELLQINGYQTPVKTYVVKTPDPSACPTCANCGNCNCVILAKMFKEAIDADLDNVVQAKMIHNSSIGGPVEVSLDKWQDWVDNPANVDECLALEITVRSEDVYRWCQIPMNYNWLREVDYNVSAIGGFQQTPADITVTQNIVYEQGGSYDMKWYEYFAGGWYGRPGIFRQLAVNGLPQREFFYTVDDTKKYDQYTFLYNLSSISGWRKYENNLETTVAIPIDDKSTTAAFETAINAIRTALQDYPGNAFVPL
jgi:hypothetical protein